MYKLASHFDQLPGFSVVVVLPNSEGIAQAYAASDVTVRVVPFMPLGAQRSIVYRLHYLLSLPPTIWRLIKLIRQEGIDVVHVNEITFFPALIAARLCGVPTVCHVRVILRKRFPRARRILSRLIATFSDHIITSSEATTVGLFNNPPDGRVTVSYDGGPDRAVLDPTRYDRDVLRDTFGFANTLTVGLVSKLTPVKGHRYLLGAAALLKERHPDIPWRFVFVGGEVGGFEAYGAALRNETRELGLDDVVLFLGQRSDVPELMLSFDIVVHVPDHDDPFPGVVLEALAMERPVVATRSGGIPEQMEDGISGILIEKGCVEELAEAIAALAKDMERRQNMGREARRYVLDNFSPEQHFGDVECIYRKLAEDRVA
jgi:glycosyltransferase involved in cell wall biosynthesis